MPVKMRRGKARGRLAPGKVKSLLQGPEEVLITGGYFNCGCAQIHTLDPAERRAAELEMLEDWQDHREYLLGIWRGTIPDPNAESRWFRIKRHPGACWAQRRFEGTEGS